MADQKVHVDGKKLDRKGWFAKKEDGQPISDYRKSCGDGFKDGVKWDAHHVLPQTAIVQSIDTQKAPKRKYITIVQLITDWNINKTENLLGLPQFISYLYYYRRQDDLVSEQSPKLSGVGELAKVKGYINTFNKARRALLKTYAGITISPENYPIHRPVSWGHTDYNQKVKGDLKRVWDGIQEQQKAHQMDATTVEGALNTLATNWKKYLRARGVGANRQKWDCRNDVTNKSWYHPFTMVPLKKNPLFK